jgi:general secretion pathway protein E
VSTGYYGRTGIAELLNVDDETREQIMNRLGANLIKQAAVRKGMVTLRDDGIAKVLAGSTTLDEVLRVTQEDVLS